MTSKPYQVKLRTPKIKNKGCNQKVYPYEISVHGKRERERRKRQIERGQLRVENGLVA